MVYDISIVRENITVAKVNDIQSFYEFFFVFFFDSSAPSSAIFRISSPICDYPVSLDSPSPCPPANSQQALSLLAPFLRHHF